MICPMRIYQKQVNYLFFKNVTNLYTQNYIVLGFVMVSHSNYLNGYSHFKPEVIICNDEIELVNTFIQLVNSWDPEIICGYEVNLVMEVLIETCTDWDYFM